MNELPLIVVAYLETSRDVRVDWRACEGMLSCSSPSCPLGWATRCRPRSPPRHPRSRTRSARSRPPLVLRADDPPTPSAVLNQRKVSCKIIQYKNVLQTLISLDITYVKYNIKKAINYISQNPICGLI